MSERFRHQFALPSVTIDINYSAHSDRGAVRELNEDSFLAVPPLFVVADGMGGHAFGDRASQAAIAAFSDAFDSVVPVSPQRIIETIRKANESVLALTIGTEAEGTISGTTLVGVALVQLDESVGYHWMAFNLGDSRLYRWDGRTLVQVSVDHSAVQEMIDAGEISAEEALTHPLRSVVTRALGADAEADSDVWLLPVAGRQTFILCSDGLTKELSDDEIARIIVFHYSAVSDGDDLAPTLAERLVNAAIAAGGSDNVTVVELETHLVGTSDANLATIVDTVERGSLSAVIEETRPRRSLNA